MPTKSPLHFQIDPHSGMPVYRQVMAQLKYYIASGTLGPGDQIPSIRELAVSLGVNPTTIVKAYTELEHEDVIAMKHGKGAFIAERSEPLSPREREAMLRRLARQLAVEARQIGATTDVVTRIVAEEMDQLGNGSGSGPA